MISLVAELFFYESTCFMMISSSGLTGAMPIMFLPSALHNSGYDSTWTEI